MHLKRLELQGFKSFARPVKLEFGQGITAIVGPNGSGKSNISDAVRWVLGEQSAKSLRGQKMEDIIFAGSDGKRPLGMAEVQLTLDNTLGFLPVDYSEVTVTRRVYRSGDSEFFINKQSCRLRDIQDLFTDTGLGREGYAIIGQGEIDAVLSVRSEDRRVLLEETAGIVKYRQRKEHALKKLEETGIDLLRVTDILGELENQLEPLKEQAEKARQYLELAELLEAAELDHAYIKWKNIEERWTKGEEVEAKLRTDFDNWNNHYAELGEEKKRLEMQTKSLEEEVDAIRQELQALSESYSEGLHSIDLYKERTNNHVARSKQLETIMANKNDEIKLLKEENKGIVDEYESLNSRIKVQEQSIFDVQIKIGKLRDRHSHVQNKINSLKDEFFEFMSELAEHRNFQRSFEERFFNLKNQIATTNEELVLNSQQSDLIEDQLAGLIEKETKLNQLLLEQTTKEGQIQANLVEFRAESKKCAHELRAIEGKLARATTRLSTLRELEEGYEGYAQGVRRIMQNDKMSALVLGTIADVISVPTGLETAFEVALGAGLQNIITSNEEHAKTLISWLKQVKGGRVTILPLNSVQGSSLSGQAKKYLSQPKVLGTALELLSFSKEYEPALASLLGRVIITEDLDTALKLKSQITGFSRIVTRDGSMVFPSGAITGGSLNTRTSGLLARKAEVGALQEDLATFKLQFKEISAKEQGIIDQTVSTERQLKELREEHVQTQLLIQRTNQEKKQAEQEMANLRNYRARFEEAIIKQKKLLENLDAEQELTANKVKELEGDEIRHREFIGKQEEELNNLVAEIDLASKEETKEQISLTELKGSIEKLQIRIDNLDQQKKAASMASQEAQQELDRLSEEVKEFEKVIAETAASNEIRKREQGKLQMTFEEKRQERQIVLKEISALEEELLKAQKEQLQKERALYKWEMEHEQLGNERANILESLAEKGLNLASILVRDVERNESALKKDIDGLRRKINALGLVNPAATQEYERVQQRCVFLRTQLADLDQARESLQDVITEMDKLCRTKLSDTFEKVRVEFQKLFNQLFSGGQADLIMTDPDSILTTGIEIMARPPGKKLRNLLLLSGGERALTAIALLFAIRKVKPTPFCVLDEIDAALDDSNLHRFAELMVEFSKETQFLVITHRPGTMEAAHTLYGVTMGEEAYSQIISVSLT